MSNGDVIRNYDYESKLLALELKENEAKYISGELSLTQPLEKTDRLYHLAFAAAEKTTASTVLQDSTLMQIQCRIMRQIVKQYKPNTLVFNARDFSVKLKQKFSDIGNEDESRKGSCKTYSQIWQKLGEECLKRMHPTPTFNFISGTFKSDPVAPVKRKRKQIEKEKFAIATKPQTVSLSEAADGKDAMLNRATKVLSILIKLCQKPESNGAVCFYEFITDPHSFTHTIENVFTVSLLVQTGHAYIFEDKQGLPCLKYVTEEQKKEHQLDPNRRIQTVFSLGVAEWKDIIKKFKFTKALIPPKKLE